MAERKKKAPTALPAHLEEFLTGLEAQALAGEDLDRVKILREVQAKHQVIFDPDAEMKEHPEAEERFGRVMAQLYMGMEDAEINRVRKGKASAGPFIRNRGRLTKVPGSGRLQLEREHRTRVDGHRSGW